MKKIIFILALSTGIYSCGTKTEEKSPDAQQGDSIATAEFIGAKFEIGKPLAMTDLSQKIATDKGASGIVIEGKITEVCQKKGCWMNIEKGDGTTMMVRFKDYGFFMPFDCSGKTAIMHGNAFMDTVSVEDLRHYAEDAGKTEEEIAKITESKLELAFEADGVVLK